jgi:membrane protein YqaA with SNARE-associated domain
MRLFSYLYQKALCWAEHRHAPIYLGCVSFAEAAFFIMPPDLILAPMTLAKPEHAWRYSLLTTLTSVAGSLLGYLIGHFFYALIAPYIHMLGYDAAYMQVMQSFERWGALVILVAAFTPLPYKLFTIGAGVFNLSLVTFILASLLGRGLRFFLVAGLIRYAGVKLEKILLCYIDRLGWGLVALLGAVFGLYYSGVFA